MGGAHSKSAHRWRRADRTEARDRSRTSWPRFALLVTPALIAVGLIGAGAVTGAVPVALAVQGQQTVKISVKTLSLQAAATMPEFFQTRDGQRRTTVVIGLRHVVARGLCASTRVNSPVGSYVLRITTPDNRDPVQVGDLRFALDHVDGLGVLGNDVALNRAFTANGTPTDATDPGWLPIQAGGLLLNLNVTVQWVTANQLALSGVTLAVGKDQKECF